MPTYHVDLVKSTASMRRLALEARRVHAGHSTQASRTVREMRKRHGSADIRAPSARRVANE
jgi:hypothetical protein